MLLCMYFPATLSKQHCNEACDEAYDEACDEVCTEAFVLRLLYLGFFTEAFVLMFL